MKPKKEARRMKLETERIVGEILEDLEGWGKREQVKTKRLRGDYYSCY